MSDELRDRFEAFRADSIAHARPPGVRAVKRRVARQRSARAVALIAVAVVVAVLSWLPGGHGGRAPAPIGPTALSPSPSPSASPGASGPASGIPAPSRPPASTGHPSCPHAERYLSRIDPDTYVIPTELINACPSVRLRLVRVTYIGSGGHPAELTRYASETLTLSPSVRSVMFPPVNRPSGTCYAYETVVLVSPHGGTPATVPSTARTDKSVRSWFTRRGYPVVDVEWADPHC